MHGNFGSFVAWGPDDHHYLTTVTFFYSSHLRRNSSYCVSPATWLVDCYLGSLRGLSVGYSRDAMDTELGVSGRLQLLVFPKMTQKSLEGAVDKFILVNTSVQTDIILEQQVTLLIQNFEIECIHAKAVSNMILFPFFFNIQSMIIFTIFLMFLPCLILCLFQLNQ